MSPEKRGPSHFVAEEALHRFAQESRIGLVVNTHGEIAGYIDRIRRFQDQIGEMIDCVIAVDIRTAELIIAAVVEKETAQVKFRLFIGDASGTAIVLVIRQQQLIKLPTRRTAVVEAAEHAEMAHPLNRLAHGCGDPVRHAKIDIRHFLKIPLQHRIAFNQREFRQLAGDPAQKADDCLDHGDFAVIELISFGTI